ncbi:response regulator [Candidatus Magnetominusculus xianensis]|uniref:Two-component system response regulator n=1 Tax=Candidatus Magnetominusculus xianensis TaxID=1748249 RepID=A0ABR5SJQ8_9BACT|nr:response regulator [Candidatus Magnetominusculus xianensis]KWT92708.1 two-component system response regulator [Candidatus Magnetominusculus xianensis]MBF0403741.1 response regulator [Nitrospirota bacterium]
MPKRLLLADDSITIQKVVELILSEEDFQIISVNDGQEALDKINKFNPSIVLADIEMPKVNGYELCKQIKANEKTKHIPVILLVGAFEPLNERSFKDCGASDHLIKPFESQEFLNKINAVLGPSSSSDGEVTTFDEAGKGEEPVDLGDSLMGDDDIEELLGKSDIDDTGVFEEGQSISEDSGEFQSMSDSDLTTRELKDVLDSLSGGTDERDSSDAKVPDSKGSTVMDENDIEALLAGTMAEESSDIDNSDAQKTVVIAEELPIETSAAETPAHHEPSWNEQTQDVETSFANEDILLGMSQPPEISPVKKEPEIAEKPQPVIQTPQAPRAPEPQVSAPPREPVRPQAAATPPPFAEPQSGYSAPSSHAGNVLLTTGDVTYILQRSLEQKVTQVIDEGTILSTFRESVDGYINNSFKDVSVGLNDMVSEAINKKISDVIGTINLEVIVNQVISSTIKGILATLPAEIFKMTRDVTERVITGVLQDNIPAIKRDVEKVIWEAVPGVAERLINHEIEQIKSEFM